MVMYVVLEVTGNRPVQSYRYKEVCVCVWWKHFKMHPHLSSHYLDEMMQVISAHIFPLTLCAFPSLVKVQFKGSI